MNDWLAASNFERTFGIVSAINALSAHVKLALAGVTDPTEPADIDKAKTTLLGFIDRLNTLTSIGRNSGGAVAGADPRMRELASQFMAEQRRLPPRALLYKLSLSQLKGIVGSERDEDKFKLIECLKTLRTMLEQHAHADVPGVFGEE